MKFDTTHIVSFLTSPIVFSLYPYLRLEWSGDSILVNGKRLLRKSVMKEKVDPLMQQCKGTSAQSVCPFCRLEVASKECKKTRVAQ